MFGQSDNDVLCGGIVFIGQSKRHRPIVFIQFQQLGFVGLRSGLFFCRDFMQQARVCQFVAVERGFDVLVGGRRSHPNEVHKRWLIHYMFDGIVDEFGNADWWGQR